MLAMRILGIVLHAFMVAVVNSDDCPRTLSIAIFAQYNSLAKKDIILPCIANVVQARDIMTSPFPAPLEDMKTKPHCIFSEEALTVDVFMSFSNNIAPPAQKRLLNGLGSMKGITNAVHYTEYFPGYSAAPSPFLFMLNQTAKAYDLSLKIRYGKPLNYKSVKHSLECMCGTPSHVISIVQGFLRDRSASAVGPQGFVFGQQSLRRNIAPFVDVDQKVGFSEKNMNAVNKATEIVGGVISIDGGGASNVVMIGGGTFWSRSEDLRFSELRLNILELVTTVEDIEIFLDVLFPSMANSGTGDVRMMLPAPKLLPLYFPQYHKIPENDRFWGDGFTEWTLLKPLDLPKISKPLPMSQGGLGYYDLTEADIRKKQAEMMRLFGGHGFVFYHYWFSGKGAPADHKVMYKIPELMLKDGHPDVPFMFSWANEPWSRRLLIFLKTLDYIGVDDYVLFRWTGAAEDVMMEQNYGDETEWVAHFEYLKPFFKNQNYIKYRGSPVFVIYRIGHFGDKLRPMMQLWVQLAIKNGFPGIYFITTIGNFYSTDPGTPELVNVVPELKAAMQFWPLVKMSFPRHQHGKDLKNVSLPQYWGAHTGFDARPRIPDRPIAEIITPGKFESFLRKMFVCTDIRRWKNIDDNFLFITAWNEWNEQAIMEPGTMFGFGFLTAMRNALQTINFCSYS